MDPSWAPALVLEVPSDPESSRRPSRTSFTGSELSQYNISPLPSPSHANGQSLLPQPRGRRERRASSHDLGSPGGGWPPATSPSRNKSLRDGSGPEWLAVPGGRQRGASLPGGIGAEELYRLRNFSTKGKRVINKGDSFKSKSRTSISSSHLSSRDSSPASDRSRRSSIRSRASSPRGSSRRGSIVPSHSATSSHSREEAAPAGPPASLIRVLLLGASGVGKSSLCAQFLSSEHINAYDKVEDSVIKEVSVAVDGKETRVAFVDHMHGEMSVENQLGTYSPDVCLVVVAVDDWTSMDQAERILAYLQMAGVLSESPAILVANKADLVRNRQVKAAAGKSLAQKYGIKYIETSPGINHNVDELLVGILTQLRLKRQKAQQERTKTSKVMDFLGKFVTMDLGKSCSNLNML